MKCELCEQRIMEEYYDVYREEVFEVPKTKLNTIVYCTDCAEKLGRIRPKNNRGGKHGK